MLRVGIWAAVSSRQQAGEDKASIPDQLAAGESFAAAIGAQVVARYTTGHSRDIVFWHEAEAAMASYRQLREDIEAGRLDLVWIMDPDRAGRDPALAEQLYSLARKNGVEVYVSTSPHPVGQQSAGHRYLFSIQATRAGEDQALRKHRFQSGMRGRVLRRGIHAGHWPLGYSPLRDEAGKTVGAELNEGAGAVLEVTRLFLAGVPLMEIARRMNAGPYRPMHSDTWRKSTVEKIIRNDCYAGLLHLNDERTTEPSDKFPALWDGPTFAEVVRERQRRSRAPYHRTGGGPFSGVAFCGLCGAPMYRAVSHKNRALHYLNCGRHFMDRSLCQPNNIPEHRVVRALSSVLAALTNQAVLDATLARLGDGGAERALRDDRDRAAAHAADLADQRLRLAHALAAGKMDPAIYVQVDGDIADQLGAERGRAADLDRAIAALPDVDGRREVVASLARNFGRVVATVEPATVAAMLQRAGIRLFVAEGKISRVEVG